LQILIFIVFAALIWWIILMKWWKWVLQFKVERNWHVTAIAENFAIAVYHLIALIATVNSWVFSFPLLGQHRLVYHLFWSILWTQKTESRPILLLVFGQSLIEILYRHYFGGFSAFVVSITEVSRDHIQLRQLLELNFLWHLICKLL